MSLHYSCWLLIYQERLERERKEREKQKKKDKIQRQKDQGTYLTAKQKEDRRRAQQMLEALGQKGTCIVLCRIQKTRFLRATAYMLSAHMLSQFRPSVRLSVRLSHG